jgi:hypothetical protein
MRWRPPKFALFAVIVLLAGGVFTAPPAEAEPTVETQVGLFWRGEQVDAQPTGKTPFFVAVISSSGTERPLGNVNVKVDGHDPPPPGNPKGLKEVPASDNLAREACGDNPCSISDDFELDLGFSPHYFKTDYLGDATFKPSLDELGFARGNLDASSQQSEDGDPVTYTFQLLISGATPSNRRPQSGVDFFDDQNHSSGLRPLDQNLRAEWTTEQNTGVVTTTATYTAGGEDVFLPFTATRVHSVTGRTQPTSQPGPTATTRRTTTTRRTLGRTPTTAALSPINPGATSTTVFGETTSTFEAFGDFTTSAPSTTGELAAASNNDDGPPIAVVATTLLALAGLGGVAAFRRYRKGGIDWF